jgi:hypothetical protein
VPCLNHSLRTPRRSSAAANIPRFGQYSRVAITEIVFGVYSRTYASHDNVPVLCSLGNEAFCPPRNARAILPLRGYCDGVSGSRVCLNSSAAGFFGGPSCAVCDPWYSSTGGSVRCPGLTNPCSAHGTVASAASAAASAVTMAPTARRRALVPAVRAQATACAPRDHLSLHVYPTAAASGRLQATTPVRPAGLGRSAARRAQRTSASSAPATGCCPVRATAPLGTAARRA